MKLQQLTEEFIPKTIRGWWNVPEDLYHKGPGYGSSNIKSALKSPAHIAVKFNPSASMNFGSAAHAAILEPHRFESEWVLKPSSVDLRTKEGKAWAGQNAGKKIVNASDAEAISAIQARLSKSKTWGELSAGGFNETSLYEEFGGILLRGRFDLMTCTGDRVDIIDVKTTQDASKNFLKQALNLGYHIQAAMYSDLAAKVFGLPTRFVWVAIESEEPYGAGFYQPDEHTLALGRGKVIEALKIIKRAEEETGFDYVYPDQIIETNLPRWAEYELLGDL